MSWLPLWLTVAGVDYGQPQHILLLCGAIPQPLENNLAPPPNVYLPYTQGPSQFTTWDLRAYMNS